MSTFWKMDIGATVLDEGGVRFRLWAPKARKVSVHLLSGQARGLQDLTQEEMGYFSATISGCADGDLYLYRLEEGDERPDPASRCQPEGVHGPSKVVDASRYRWDDENWRGMPLEDYILYELHVGTFSPQGTFDGVIERLDALLELGVTAVELMPVAQFPGGRNWGYDGAYPFAVQQSYGGPEGLKRLVDACHRKGLAVVLDVVYNHLGPEGNYLCCFGPYFTDRYRTPWGDALNFDGPHSDAVRHYFISNALYWISEFHLDGLRLDAVHGIYDFSARHILEELACEVHRLAQQLGRPAHIIAESDLNDARLIRPRLLGGYGLDAQWNDDFHHALHCLLTKEKGGYYRDFGAFSQLAKAYREGFVYSGQYSEFRGRRHGNDASDCPPRQLLVFCQNHDQVGNRLMGERLSTQLRHAPLRLAAASVLLSPYLPLLFMGEEYGEQAPFLYFISHGDARLIEAVRKGRAEEFTAFDWKQEPPDPQAEETFQASRLDFGLKKQGRHARLYAFYRELIRLRKQLPWLRPGDCRNLRVRAQDEVLLLLYGDPCRLLALLHFGPEPRSPELELPPGRWRKILDAASPLWGGDEEPSPQWLDCGEEKQPLRLPAFGCLLYEKDAGNPLPSESRGGTP